ncbi:unnamed protein product, partial [Allacma fusca]
TDKGEASEELGVQDSADVSGTDNRTSCKGLGEKTGMPVESSNKFNFRYHKKSTWSAGL